MFRILVVIDDCTRVREAGGTPSVWRQSWTRRSRGYELLASWMRSWHGGERPKCIVSGPELTFRAILEWTSRTRIEWHYIAPGKPQQSAYAVTFIGRMPGRVAQR